MKPTIDIIVTAAALLAFILVADAWRSARHDSAQLAATVAAQSAAIQQAGDREKLRDAQLASALAAIQAQKRSVQSPQQAARELPSILPPLPLPISIREPALSSLTPLADAPPASISVPQPDLAPLYSDLQDCRATALESNTLKKDLEDEKTRSASLARERDAAISAARGGTSWVRLKRTAKWFAIGAAAGAVATAVAHHQ
jgi:type II secretory pathway pseudopilin PulG